MRALCVATFVLPALVAWVVCSAAAVSASDPNEPRLITISDASVAEGDSGRTAMVFHVQVFGDRTDTTRIVARTSDGTATAGDSDYIAVIDTVKVGPEDHDGAVTVWVRGDRRIEANERFLVRLDAVPGFVMAPGSGTGTIRNDERPRFERLPSLGYQYLWAYGPAFGDPRGDRHNELVLYSWSFSRLLPNPQHIDVFGFYEYHGGAWCDFDRDGDLDYVQMPYASNTPTPLRLLRYDQGTLTDIAPALGVDVVGHGETPVWGDFDGDGWPDLFAPFYAYLPPGQCFLFHNQGDGTFRDIADSVGVAMRDVPEAYKPEGAHAVDLDGDGALDLYCASGLFINDGTGRFTDQREARGLPREFDEGAQFVDFDDDGDFDLYIRTNSGLHLYRNDGGQFTDVVGSLGLPTGLTFDWGDRWADLDNDGDLDLLVFGQPEPVRLMLARGDGTFEMDSSFSTLDGGNTNLSAFADLDGDGDLDIAIGTSAKYLVRNDLDELGGARSSFLEVRVLDAEGHQTQHGATVWLTSLDDPRHPTQTRAVDGGSGYLAQDQYDVHFGGVGSGRFALRVSFPSTAAHPVRVDSTVIPWLGSLAPGTVGGMIVTVRRDSTGSLYVVPPPAAAVSQTAGPEVGRLASWPNPARTAVEFRLDPAVTGAALEVFDLGGRRLRRLDLPATDGPGARRARWDLRDAAGRPVATGIYLVRVAGTRGAPLAQRVIVLR